MCLGIIFFHEIYNLQSLGNIGIKYRNTRKMEKNNIQKRCAKKKNPSIGSKLFELTF